MTIPHGARNKTHFNPTADIERPGRIPCGACGQEVEGDNALDTIMLLVAHLRSVNDEAHRREAQWIAQQFKQRNKLPAREAGS